MMKSIFTKDPDHNRIQVSREFAGSPERVWDAWTKPELLDQWWAPRPWKATTKSMDFRNGGQWLYSMEGPDGTKSWSSATFSNIEKEKFYEGDDNFCDENGVPDPNWPKMNWKVSFEPSDAGTRVNVDITFGSRADMEKIMEMGFEQGFAAAHGNLDELLANSQ